MFNLSSQNKPVFIKDNKIRVAFVVWTFEGMGGSEHVVYDIIRKMDRDRFEVVIIGFKDGPVRDVYEKLKAKVFVVTKSRKKFDIEFILSLRNVLLSNNVQLVNAHHFGPLLYSFCATRMTCIKIVHTEHSVWQYLEMDPLQKVLSNYILWRSSAVIAISKQLYQYYNNNKFVSAKKTHLIVNGIDLSRFKRRVDCSLRKKMGFADTDILIGMVANIRPEKNHKFLISAFANLHKKINNSHLILVGLDCMNGEVHQYASASGCGPSIHFWGSREDVADILYAFDVFCLTSVHEGLPLTVLEAMACGVPVVGADVLGINEVISDNETGLLYDADNEAMLVEKLMKIIRDSSLRTFLSQAALEHVQQQFDLNKKIEAYEKLYTQLGGQDAGNDSPTVGTYLVK